jgi:raffinose/stachyose/melibiose transport system permease protein
LTKTAPGAFRQLRTKEILWGYAFLLPILALMGLFVVYGLYFVIKISFFRWDGVDPESMAFRGLKNYALLFTDPVFLSSIFNAFVFLIVTVTVQMFVGLMVALLLRPRLAGHRFYKALFYIPVALSTTVIARTFMGLYEPNFGILNALFTSPVGQALGLAGWAHSWLGDPNTALGSVIFANIFQWMGAQMVFYIAGLTTISDDVFEAAQIDGAGFWHTLTKVVWPSLWPTHTTVIILGMVGAVKTFDIVWLLTQGGPGNSTQFPATLLYQAVAQNFEAGYGASISVVMIALCVGLSAIQLAFNQKKREA